MNTIRKNNLKAIRAILDKAALIKSFSDDGQDSTSGKITAADAMQLAPRFKRVHTDNHGTLVISLGGSYTITAYPSIAVAKHCLVPQAFAKYFGGDHVEPELRMHRGALRTESEISELERLRRAAFPHLYT